MPRPEVLVPVALLAERLGAHAARVRPVAGVDALVVLQRVRAVEALLARLAAVAPLAAVDQPVLVVDGAREEGLAAHAAPVRPLARVALADVVVEVGPDREAPAAARTRAAERLYSCAGETSVNETVGRETRGNTFVEAEVLVEVARLRVSFAANVAQIGPFVRLRGLAGLVGNDDRVLAARVQVQVGGLQERLSALHAQILVPGFRAIEQSNRMHAVVPVLEQRLHGVEVQVALVADEEARQVDLLFVSVNGEGAFPEAVLQNVSQDRAADRAASALESDRRVVPGLVLQQAILVVEQIVAELALEHFLNRHDVERTSSHADVLRLAMPIHNVHICEYRPAVAAFEQRLALRNGLRLAAAEVSR